MPTTVNSPSLISRRQHPYRNISNGSPSFHSHLTSSSPGNENVFPGYALSRVSSRTLGSFSSDDFPLSGPSAMTDGMTSPYHQEPQCEDNLVVSTRVAEVTRRCGAIGLPVNLQKEALEFAKMPSTSKMDALYILGLKMVHAQDEAAREIKALANVVTGMREEMVSDWKVTSSQKNAFKILLGHQLIRGSPVIEAKQVLNVALKYIIANPHKYDVPDIQTSEKLKAEIKNQLRLLMNNVRSTYRKMLWTVAKKPLLVAVRRLTIDFHMRQEAIVNSDLINAYVALQRKIAIPLSEHENKKGADTGFWKAFEKELASRVSKYGSRDLSSPEWAAWRNEIVEADIQKWGKDVAEDEDESNSGLDEVLGGIQDGEQC